MKSTGLTTRCFSPVQRKPAKADFFLFLGESSPAGRRIFPRRCGKPQSRRLGGGACGVRKSSRRGCVGASPPQRKAPQGVKKARRRKRGFFGTPPPIGRRGLRGAEVLPPWLRGASPPQRKAPQGVKKARRGGCGVCFGTPHKKI